MSAAVRAVWRNKALWSVHVIANAVLLAAIYGWLSIPDSSVVDVVLSAAAALGILLVTSWLHTGTVEYFRMNHETGSASVRSGFRPSIRRIVLFALWMCILGTVMVLVLQLKDRLGPASNWIASALTFRLRRPVHPTFVAGIVSTLARFAAFVVAPFLLLQFWKWRWSRTYLFTYVVLLVVGAYLPYKLVWWVPKFSGLYAQTASMTLRFSVAYLLAVTGWLILASTLGQIRKA